eukprot:COSAG01_NODE_318_length_18932_cov_26.063983_7_plen_136_part_00
MHTRILFFGNPSDAGLFCLEKTSRWIFRPEQQNSQDFLHAYNARSLSQHPVLTAKSHPGGPAAAVRGGGLLAGNGGLLAAASGACSGKLRMTGDPASTGCWVSGRNQPQDPAALDSRAVRMRRSRAMMWQQNADI